MLLALCGVFLGALKIAMPLPGRMIVQSMLRRGPIWLCLLMLLLLAVPGCVSGGPIVAAASACSALLPQEWRAPVPGAPLPGSDSAAEWVSFGDAQTGQLDKANDRTLSSIGIVERCEARDADAVRRAKRRWWQIWR